MEGLKYYTLRESIAHRLKFLIDLPRVCTGETLETIKNDILITPDCFNGALLSMSKSNFIEYNRLKEFLETLNAFLWSHRFPETAREYTVIFGSSEWDAIRNKAKALMYLFNGGSL